MVAGDSLHHQLQDHLDSQQWEEARDIAYQLLENTPESSWLHSTLGIIYFSMNQYKGAETHLKHAIYHQENHAEAHAYLGKVYLKMNRMGSADDCCNRALAIDSSNLKANELAFHLKLAYKDLDGARDCYARLERLGADACTLREMEYSLIRHPSHKQPIDYASEIISCREHLAVFPQHAHSHAQLASLYHRYTDDSELAEKHITIALESDLHHLFFQETSMLIQRENNFYLRMLTAPVMSLTRPEKMSKLDVVAVWIITLAIIMFTIINRQNPWMLRAGIFTLIAIYFSSYTGSLAFQYLSYTERFHQLGKTSLLGGMNRNIHCLPYTKRFLLISIFTLSAWMMLAAFLYFLTR